MLPTPDLSDGSCAAPPPKAYSIAIRGTVASCTNQASMPPGETRRWIFAAACDGADASNNSAAQAARIDAKVDAKRGAPMKSWVTSASPRVSAENPGEQHP